jgi:hypothetical protein
MSQGSCGCFCNENDFALNPTAWRGSRTVALRPHAVVAEFLILPGLVPQLVVAQTSGGSAASDTVCVVAGSLTVISMGVPSAI